MPDLNPEELVAKLYEQGMTDEEIKGQLIEFGLSGREIHVLIKNAKEILKRGFEKQKGVQNKPTPGPQEVQETIAATQQRQSSPTQQRQSPPGYTQEKPYTAEFYPEDNIEEFPEDSGIPPAKELLAYMQKPAEVTPGDEKALEPKVEKMPVGANEATSPQEKKPFFGGLFAKKPDSKKPEEPRGRHRMDGLTNAIQKPAEATLGAEKLPDVKADEKTPVDKEVKSLEKKPLFGNLFAKRLDSKKPGEPNTAPVDVGHTDTQKPVDKEVKSLEKKPLFGNLFAKKLDSKKPAEPNAMPMEGAPTGTVQKPAEAKLDKGSNRSGKVIQSATEAQQLKLKRLALIKAEISRPAREIVKSAPTDLSTAVSGNMTKANDANNTDDEDEMDEETKRKLVDGIDSLQQEMSEIKQLLETMRELNIKLIELMEKR